MTTRRLMDEWGADRLKLAAAEARVKELASAAIGAASDLGLYYGEDADSAIQCMESEVDGFHKLMWRIMDLCRADSAKPDDVFAAVEKAVKDGKEARARVKELEAAIETMLRAAEAATDKALEVSDSPAASAISLSMGVANIASIGVKALKGGAA